MAFCKCCHHPRLNMLDAALLRGEPLTVISKKFKVSTDSLGRHRRHQRSAVLLATAQAPNRGQSVEYGNHLLHELSLIRTDVERAQAESEKARDFKTMLLACKQRADLVKLEAELTGQLESGSKNVSLHLHQTITPAQAVDMAQDIIRLYGSELPQLPAAESEVKPQ